MFQKSTLGNDVSEIMPTAQVFKILWSLLKPFVLLFQAHLVAAFEQSLGNMTIRLKSLTLTAEQKVRTSSFSKGRNWLKPRLNFVCVQDTELNDLRKTIELLKKQNAVAQAAINGVINTPELVPKKDKTGRDSPQTGRALPRLERTDAVLKTSVWMSAGGSNGSQLPQQPDLRIRRQHSSDSVSSINSATSHSSVGSNMDADAKNKKKNKKNWVR